MTLEPLGVEHIPQARAFWPAIPGLSLGSSDEPRALKAFFDRNPGLSWGAFADRTLVGTVLAGHDGRRGFLYHLAVAPDFQGRGLATQLITRALEGLHQCGIGKIHVFVLADNPPGLSFWAHAAGRGWARRGDLLVFSRTL